MKYIYISLNFGIRIVGLFLCGDFINLERSDCESAMISALEQVWPAIKIGLCMTHIGQSVNRNCKKLFGEDEWKSNSSLREILFLWVGCGYLPLVENDLDLMIKDRIIDIIRNADIENIENKLERMRIYMSKYFTRSGQFRLQRWNFSNCTDVEPFVGSTNGCEGSVSNINRRHEIIFNVTMFEFVTNIIFRAS